MVKCAGETESDAHDDVLVANVHPSEWQNPTPARSYNLVVIGAGTAGLVSAAGAAGLGAKVALVESHLLGGECLNVGCVPSKALIACSRAAHAAARAAQFGVCTGDVAVDFDRVMARVRRVRSQISFHDAAKRFRSMGIDVFFGQARFIDERTVEVDGLKLPFARAVIATGARAVRPAIDGIDSCDFLTNETLFSLRERPGRLGVVGAGPVGVEMAQAFKRLSSDVTIIEKGQSLHPREDRDATAILEESFRRDGVNMLLNTVVERITASEGGKTIHLAGDGAHRKVIVDEILIGAGRAPNVQGLALEAAGVEYDQRAGVKTDDFLRTTNRRVYAAGDVCLRHKFTHTADAAARIVIQNALFFGRKRVSVLNIPWCTYTDPEIAHVGLYPEEARSRGMEVETFRRDLTDVDRAICDGQIEGFVKVHVKQGTDSILGATIVAAHAGDMISEISTAMAGKVGLAGISSVIHPYPTQAEVIRQVADAYNRTRLSARLKSILVAIMKIRR